MSRAPPPRATIFGCRLFASATISVAVRAAALRDRRRRIAHVDELHLADQDRIGGARFESADSRAVRAAADSPATIDGSSTHNGTT